MSHILIESMTRIVGIRNEYTARIWREEGPGCTHDRTDLQKLAVEIESELPGERLSREDIARSFLALPRVNAVEVVDGDGNGVVLYSNWP